MSFFRRGFPKHFKRFKVSCLKLAAGRVICDIPSAMAARSSTRAVERYAVPKMANAKFAESTVISHGLSQRRKSGSSSRELCRRRMQNSEKEPLQTLAFSALEVANCAVH